MVRIYDLTFFERSKVLLACDARGRELRLGGSSKHLWGGSKVDAVKLRVDVERAVVPLCRVVALLEVICVHNRSVLGHLNLL